MFTLQKPRTEVRELLEQAMCGLGVPRPSDGPGMRAAGVERCRVFRSERLDHGGQ